MRAHGVRLAELLRVHCVSAGVGVAAVGALDARVTADLDDVEAGESIRRLAKDHATAWIALAARRGAGRLPSDPPDARVRAHAPLSGAPAGSPTTRAVHGKAAGLAIASG